MTKRTLVTGGAGFIGSHLCERLLAMNREVLCLDNFFTGSKDNIRALLKHPRFELIRHDIVEPILLEADEIYHLACPASPIHYQHNPVKTIKTNVIGTLNMLGIAKRVKARILLSSTSEVYGDPMVHPQVEGYWGNVNPIGIRSCYDEGKRVAESLMVSYHMQNDVDIRIARIFNTYGPHMAPDDGRVISNFARDALNGDPLTIYGDGKQTRSFCYVSDMVEGLIKLMESESYTGPINLGNPNEMEIIEVAHIIKGLTKSSSKIVFEELPQDDPKRRLPDITKARHELGWKPNIPFEEGIKKTIDYFRGLKKEREK
jgi:UDP-glucuronate decarboxylase